jgi:hypothetical protein
MKSMVDVMKKFRDRIATSELPIKCTKWDMGYIAILWLLGMLTACSGSQASQSTEPPQGLPQSLYESVLVVRFIPGGQAEHSWQPALDWSHELSNLRARTASSSDSIVLASSRPRDCDQEQIDCHRDCMRRKPPYPHGARRSHGHIEYCNNKCLNEYMDCLKLQKLEALSFPAIDRAADWLRRYQREVMIGTIVVAAGAAFVVISAGAGLIVLAPMALLT